MPTSFCGSFVTNIEFKPKIESETATFASPPQKVASKLSF